MKKLVLVFISLALFAGNSVAQYARNGQNTAELMQRMSINDPYLYQKYRSGSALSGVGAGLTIGGLAVAILGFATADSEEIKDGNTTRIEFSGEGAVIGTVGVVCALAGTPLWIIGSSKKRNARNNYLRKYSNTSYMQLKVVPNGLGIAYVF